ncbi:TPA: hypothetical protein ENS27_02030, partial [bacterium]|nr:hypothetical protein [bacterium]
MKTYIPIILFFIVIIFTSNISATPISVPMDHWSYQFIERLQAKGILKEYLSNTKPYTRDEVADMIFYTSNMLDEGKIRLSKIQKEQLEELKREFAQELKSRGISDINGYKHVINWSDKNKSVIVDMALRQDATIKTGDKNDRIFNTFLDFEFKAQVAHNTKNTEPELSFISILKDTVQNNEAMDAAYTQKDNVTKEPNNNAATMQVNDIKEKKHEVGQEVQKSTERVIADRRNVQKDEAYFEKPDVMHSLAGSSLHTNNVRAIVT